MITHDNAFFDDRRRRRALGSVRQRLARWWRWLAPRPLDQISIVLYPVALLYFVVMHLPPFCRCAFPWATAASIAAPILLLLLLNRWEYRRYGLAPPPRAALVLMALRTALLLAAVQLEDEAFTDYFALMIPFTAALTVGSGTAWTLGGLTLIFLMLRLDAYQPGWELNTGIVAQVVSYSLGVVFVVTMGRLVRQEQNSRVRTEQLLAELEDSHQQLHRYAGTIAELATVDERNRLAREIHDSLGHYLTVINVQLEKAQAFRSKDGAVADRAVDDSKRLAREALDDVRRSVGMLRAKPELFALAPALHELAARVRGIHVAVTVTVDVDEATIPPLSRLALYRVAQEALTNVQRHARASAVQVALCGASSVAQLSITDNGVGFAVVQGHNTGLRGGYGLQGIQERLAAVGGAVEIRSSPGVGTTITATVPCPAPIAQDAVIKGQR